MARSGVEVVLSTTDLSIVGLPHSIRMLPLLATMYLGLRKLIRSFRPDLVILIDNESMNLLIARWLRRLGIPVVFFFPPQVWFWGRWRLRALAPAVRRVVSAFDQEAALYRAAGLDTIWVGHPLRDVVEVREDVAAALCEIGLDPARPLVALMPGSRAQEVKALAGPLLGAARILQSRDPALQFAVPMASVSLRADLERAVRASGVRDAALYTPKSYAVLSRARAAIQCSGTATLEAALLGIPSVITYRCHPLAYLVGRCVMRVDYIGMVNILLDEMVQPEFFQHHVDAEHLAQEAWSLLTDEDRRRRIKQRLAALRELLGPPGVMARAAQAVLELLPCAASLNGAARIDRPPYPEEFLDQRADSAPRAPITK